MSFCTESNFEISPGLWTHNHTKDALAGMDAYGCCQKFVCGIECPKVGRAGVAVMACSSTCGSGKQCLLTVKYACILGAGVLLTRCIALPH